LENLRSCDSGSLPDVVAVGLQEVVPLTANALTVKEASPESRAWLEALSAAIGAPDNYSVLVSRQYVGIYVFVAARRELVDSSVIREAQCKAIGCGILGQFGNKGAVCVRLAVYNASVCFVCAHLAAGEEQTSRRNADMLEISKRLVFSNSKRGLISPEPSRAAAAPYQDAVKKGTLSRATSADAVSEADVAGRGGTFPGLGKSLLADITRTTEMRAGQLPFWMDPGMEARGSVIEDHDLIFWFGDLNYRLDLSRERALALLQARRLEDMFVCDQLYQQRMLGNAFVGYKETRPAFWPTYKYDLGSSEYDTSEKQRVPSWTDRVLWRCKRGACRQERYERHELGGSDHRPISASFSLDVPRVLMDKLTLVAEQVSKHLDDIDNTCAPCAHVSRTHLHFAEARYRCAQAQTVTVSNAGKVFAHFQLLPQQDLENGADAGQRLSWRGGAQGGGGVAGGGSSAGKKRQRAAQRGSEWLTAEPSFGLLMPGETRELVLTADIRDPVARTLRYCFCTRMLVLAVCLLPKMCSLYF
jgi:phosphatidylinositol-bisphosphatase